MTSTTSVKKEVIDFLWEWAENHGEWAKLLVENVLATGSALSVAERDKVFQYFLQAVKLHSGLPPLTIKKPAYTPPTKAVKITSLSEVTGVNRLAKNQSIAFSDNITVVYGENGTGKTGYSRVLKAIGYSYETGGIILSNVFKTKEPKSAKIDFETSGIKKTFTWNGSNRDDDLDSISVFNSHCVAISLADRQLVVTPIGFELFNLITDELNNLAQILNTEKLKYPFNDYGPLLNIGTPQYSFISKLSKDSSISDLKTFATFDAEDEKKLAVKNKELSSLNKSLIETTIQNLQLQIKELEVTIAKIAKAQSTLNAVSWHDLISFNEEIKQLKSQAQKGLKEFAEPYGIEFYESQEFKAFIDSAENYIKILTSKDYPKDDDVCIYCQQSLNKSAKELVTNYRTLLNDNTQIKLNEAISKKSHFKAQCAYIDSDIKFQQPIFGIDANNAIVQPIEIQNYDKEISALKNLIPQDDIAEDTFSVDYLKYLEFFDRKRNSVVFQLTSHQITLSDLATKEQKLKNEINELKDKKTLASKYADVVKNIGNLKVLYILNNNLSSFNTRSISLKTSEAREELVKQNFNAIFKKELAALNKHHIDIDLNFSTNRGNSQVIQKLKSHNLTDILSEGEQKAIALAEFLTELQLDNVISPVVFDDPVNSLDHHLIDDFARRAISLSKSRQVIIFTHSVLLFNSFLYFKNNIKGVTFQFYNTKNNHGEAGLIYDAEEINSLTDYIKKINVLLNGPKDRPEVEMAEDGYGYLRSAIELFVEIELFKGTVKRYQKNISLTLFVKVDGTQLDEIKDKINEIFERCCGFIKGHSNPTEIHNDPTLTGLKNDFEAFQAIRKLIK